jgi:hypothetical protein
LGSKSCHKVTKLLVTAKNLVGEGNIKLSLNNKFIDRLYLFLRFKSVFEKN